jgi:hypothetical protein
MAESKSPGAIGGIQVHAYGVVSPNPAARTMIIIRRFRWYADGLLAVLIMLGILLRHRLSWGDFPTWILALTTLGAFMAAVFAGLVAYDLLTVENVRDLQASAERAFAAEERARIERERQESREAAAREQAAQRAAAERAQASKVAAWFDEDQVGILPAMNNIRAGIDDWVAQVRNASDLPVFDVRVFFYWVNDTHDGRPWTTQERYASLDRLRVIPPEQTRHLQLPQTVRQTGEEIDRDSYLVAIEFTDANGIRWRRDESARLIKASEAGRP